MHSAHAKNTVRYYLLAVFFFAFLFFSNDFGLADVQKTAIVMAAGIDREGGDFLVTSQIAIPQASQQDKSTQAVQLVSRGKTIAEAFDEINAKTGWYPKLVFCKLIVFGEDAAKENVFDALDFFLRDEYLTDDCQVAVCKGSAQELLNTTALVDPSSSVALAKVLSPHAERVGTVRPVNLKDFSIGYFGDSQSGTLPLVEKQPQQEPSQNQSSEQGGASQKDSQGGNQGGSQSSEESGQSKQSDEKPVFSAKQTALFVRGRWVETLTAEETFAVNAATGKLRLANYSVEVNGQVTTLSVKRNLPKIDLNLGRDGRGVLEIRVTMIAGAADVSSAQDLLKTKDMGSIPDGALAAAEKKLSAAIATAYEKAKGVECDVFGLQERLVKYEKRSLLQYKNSIVQNTALSVKVAFENVR